ncbi:MAG: hypothetical protein LUE89_11840 [Clostridiales bacterium]|nr:hypothetical protein [Clostridiales bacterium]
MTEETRADIIRAYAIGYDAGEVAEKENMTIEEAVTFYEDNLGAIAEKAGQMSEAGLLG